MYYETYMYIIKKHLKNILYYMYNALVAQSEERVTVNHKVDRSKLSEGVIYAWFPERSKGRGLRSRDFGLRGFKSHIMQFLV